VGFDAKASFTEDTFENANDGSEISVYAFVVLVYWPQRVHLNYPM
jgi:hypothetical protein